MRKLFEFLESVEKNTLNFNIPEYLIKDLNIQEDGTVDTETLIQICIAIEKENETTHAEQYQKDMTIHRTVMNLIYNESIAINI